MISVLHLLTHCTTFNVCAARHSDFLWHSTPDHFESAFLWGADFVPQRWVIDLALSPRYHAHACDFVKDKIALDRVPPLLYKFRSSFIQHGFLFSCTPNKKFTLQIHPKSFLFYVLSVLFNISFVLFVFFFSKSCVPKRAILTPEGTSRPYKVTDNRAPQSQHWINYRETSNRTLNS